MIRYYLSQEPIIDSVPTYLAWKDDDKQFILENLDKLVVKAANESGGYGMLMGPSSTKKQRDEFKQAIKANLAITLPNPLSLFLDTLLFVTSKPSKGDMLIYVLLSFMANISK